MNTIVLAADAPSVELPKSLVQVYVSCTAPEVQVELEAVHPDGTPLSRSEWSFQPPRWVLDPRHVDHCSVHVRAVVRHEATFPSRTELQVTVKDARRQYLLRYTDGELAGRSRKDVLVLDVEDDAVRMRRADATMHVEHGEDDVREQSRTVQVLVDGSASLKAPTVRPGAERVLSALMELFDGGNRADTDRSLAVRWAVVRDGEAFPLPAEGPGAVWSHEPASIGSTFEVALLQANQDHLIVTDDVPDGIDRWLIPEGARVQVLFVGTTVVPSSSNDQVRVILDAGREESTTLLAEVAKSLGWDE